MGSRSKVRITRKNVMGNRSKGMESRTKGMGDRNTHVLLRRSMHLSAQRSAQPRVADVSVDAPECHSACNLTCAQHRNEALGWAADSCKFLHDRGDYKTG